MLTNIGDSLAAFLMSPEQSSENFFKADGKKESWFRIMISGFDWALMCRMAIFP